MEQKFNPYLNYTSTAMLTGVDEDKLTRRSVEYFIKNIQPHLPSNRKSRIMEIGCGYGRHIKALQLLGYLNVMGIDISEEQVEYAKNKLGLNNVEVGDAVTILSENKEKYDAILLLDVIEHLELEYSIKLIKLIKFNLNANGVLIIHTPNAMTPLSPNRHWDVTHLRAYTTHSMEQTLRLGEFSKMIHFELLQPVTGIISFFQRMLWISLVRPLIVIYMLITQGFLMGGIFTINILTVAYRE